MKFFDGCERSTARILGYVAPLARHFNEIWIRKLKTSRPTSSELYFVGVGFYFNADETIIDQFHLYPSGFAEFFVKRVNNSLTQQLAAFEHLQNRSLPIKLLEQRSQVVAADVSGLSSVKNRVPIGLQTEDEVKFAKKIQRLFVRPQEELCDIIENLPAKSIDTRVYRPQLNIMGYGSPLVETMSTRVNIPIQRVYHCDPICLQVYTTYTSLLSDKGFWVRADIYHYQDARVYIREDTFKIRCLCVKHAIRR